ncbi:hypothetical protein GGH92_001983 [Coemansia sp. RSA 2673]|nr:hypothetical protein GGH92_001983 [Coemansia sp. RSA 2673]
MNFTQIADGAGANASAEKNQAASSYVYDWSSSEDVANWSLTSLSTNSIISSLSMITPSPEYTPNDARSVDGCGDTLAASYLLDLSMQSSNDSRSYYKQKRARRLPPESPTDRIVKRRKTASSDQENYVAANTAPAKRRSRPVACACNGVAKQKLRTDTNNSRVSTRSRTRATAVVIARPEKRNSLTSKSQPCTPEKLLETLRPSGSPTRVSGTKVVASVKFTDASSHSLCKVEKSLVCKGFWEAIGKVGRICLPRRSGKTYNLTQLLLFFSSSLELGKLENIPNSALANNGLGAQAVSDMDVVALCRKKRECLFKDSLLLTKYPGFFKEHFMKYPVLYISLSECKGASFGTFIRALCDTFASAIKKWLVEIELTNADISIRAKYPLDELKAAQTISRISLVAFKPDAFVAQQFGQYLLLIDEYDIPFISIHLAKWSDEDKGAALDVMKTLFQKMLKDNDNLRKGLLFGVFEIPLTEMGSGANNIKDIRMIPAEESDIQGSILTAAHPHSGCGMDALTDSFWFNAHEVEQMLDNSTKWCTRIAKHKTFILQTIKKGYNGYYIGRFRGKYNPWSVSSFIEALCGLLSQTTSDEEADIAAITKSAARAYWVTTGTTGLIEAQIDRHRPQFIHLAKRLLCDYEATKSKAESSSPDKTSLEPSPPPVPLVSTRLNLINFDSELFSEPGLLMLCLYAGYLTRRLSTSVCIPNHEVYQVWLQLFARAVLGTELADNSTNNARGALLSELWKNKTNLLCTLATSSHGVLSNHNNYLENDYANHFANTIMAVSRFGMLTHPKQRTVEISHVVATRENHAGNGRCDYVMRLFSSKNRPNQFGVVIEFKLIENSRREDTAYHKERAEEGLRQIGIKNYDACLVGCLERMDVGMAIGNSAVYAVSRLFRRPNAHSAWEEVDSLF